MPGNEQAAFIIHTGDICYEKGLKAHIKLMNTENMDCPVFYCIGNHDLVKGSMAKNFLKAFMGRYIILLMQVMCTMLLRRCPEETMLQAILPMTSVVG